MTNVEKCLFYFIDKIAARDEQSESYIGLAYWFKETVNYRDHERQDYCLTRFLAFQARVGNAIPFPFTTMVEIAKGQ